MYGRCWRTLCERRNLRHVEFDVNRLCSFRARSAIRNTVLYYNLRNAIAVARRASDGDRNEGNCN